MQSKICALSTTLVLLALAPAVPAQQSNRTPTRPTSAAVDSEPKRPEYPTVYVTDLHCQHCAKRLARKLFTVPGVMKVRANVKENMAIVIPQKNKTVSPLALWEATEAAKFKVVRIETPEETIEKKPTELAGKGRGAIDSR